MTEIRDWTEARLKEVVIRAARNHGWLVYHNANRQGQHHVQKGNGYPDITMAKEPGRVMWLELKTEKGVLTDDQMLWKSLLQSYVIRPSDVVSGYLMELLK